VLTKSRGTRKIKVLASEQGKIVLKNGTYMNKRNLYE